MSTGRLSCTTSANSSRKLRSHSPLFYYIHHFSTSFRPIDSRLVRQIPVVCFCALTSQTDFSTSYNTITRVFSVITFRPPFNVHFKIMPNHSSDSPHYAGLLAFNELGYIHSLTSPEKLLNSSDLKNNYPFIISVPF